jgi:diacylglycerol kinase family enzyme
VKPAIGVVINPTSRRTRASPRIVEELAEAVGDPTWVARCETEDELTDALVAFRSREVTILAVCGGDGTMSMVLTAARATWRDVPMPALAPLRGGTMNTVANAVGVPRRTPAALLSALRSAPAHEVLSADRYCLEVGGRSGFLFGVGVVYGYLAEYYRVGRAAPTSWTAAFVLARLAASSIRGGPTARRVAAPVVLEPEIDGERWANRAYLTVMAGTVDQVGLGFRAFPRSGPDHEGFHLLAIHGSAAAVAPRLVRVRLGRGVGESVAQEALARRAVLSADGPIAYMVDGDLFERPSPLVIQVGPRVRIVWG